MMPKFNKPLNNSTQKVALFILNTYTIIFQITAHIAIYHLLYQLGEYLSSGLLMVSNGILGELVIYSALQNLRIHKIIKANMSSEYAKDFFDITDLLIKRGITLYVINFIMLFVYTAYICLIETHYGISFRLINLIYPSVTLLSCWYFCYRVIVYISYYVKLENYAKYLAAIKPLIMQSFHTIQRSLSSAESETHDI